jgi:hypothetical protein
MIQCKGHNQEFLLKYKIPKIYQICDLCVHILNNNTMVWYPIYEHRNIYFQLKYSYIKSLYDYTYLKYFQFYKTWIIKFLASNFQIYIHQYHVTIPHFTTKP